MPFHVNTYQDEVRANSYAEVGLAGTYFLAFRDLPHLFGKYVTGKMALDFGCGAGRSTRFLASHGYDVVGVDVSKPMLIRARQRDAIGDYVLIPDGELNMFRERRFDLVLSAFAFDNIATHEKRRDLFAGMAALLTDVGRIINLVSAQEIYVNEWTSFSTKDFAENRTAKTGDTVRIVMLDGNDRRPVEDVFWTHEDYESLFATAGLKLLETHRPLGNPGDPFHWVSENRISPWAIHVLSRQDLP